MPTLEDIAQAGTNLQDVSSSASDVAAGSYTVGDQLRRLVTDAFESNQDIVEPLDVATQDYLQAPQVAREQYKDIFNPFSRERLTSQYTGNMSLPMLSLSSILGQRFGRVDDLIGAGTRAYQAESARRQGDVATAQQELDNLMQQYALEEDKRRWEIEQSSAGGGDIASWLQALLDAQDGDGADGDDFIPDEQETTDTGGASELLKAVIGSYLPQPTFGSGFEGAAGGGGGGGAGGSTGGGILDRGRTLLSNLFGERGEESW